MFKAIVHLLKKFDVRLDEMKESNSTRRIHMHSQKC